MSLWERSQHKSMQISSPKSRRSGASGLLSLSFLSLTSLMGSGSGPQDQREHCVFVVHTLGRDSKPGCRKHTPTGIHASSHGSAPIHTQHSKCENCEPELQFLKVWGVGGEQERGRNETEDMVGSREDMVCWMPMGWRSGMIHCRRWRLRRQRTLAQILSAPHWFLAGVSCCLVLGFNCNGQR